MAKPGKPKRPPRQCVNTDGTPKVAYERDTAQAIARRRRSLNAYRCGACQHWHLGHRKRRPSPRSRRIQ